MDTNFLRDRADEIIAKARAALEGGGPSGRHYLYTYDDPFSEPAEVRIPTTELGREAVKLITEQAVANEAHAVLVIMDVWAAKVSAVVNPEESLEKVSGRYSSLVAMLHTPDGVSLIREQIYGEGHGRRVFIDKGWKDADRLTGLFSNPWNVHSSD